MSKKTQTKTLNCAEVRTNYQTGSSSGAASQSSPKLKKLTFEQAMAASFQEHGKLLKKLAE